MLIDKQKGRPQKTYLPLHSTFSPLILHSPFFSESRSDIYDHFLNEQKELIIAVWVSYHLRVPLGHTLYICFTMVFATKPSLNKYVS